MFKNIANFNTTHDYLQLLNGVLITDLFVIFNYTFLHADYFRQFYK
jgi:hypothetical protein